MREFGGYEATPDDHQMLGEVGDPHDRVAGVIVDPRLLDRRRNHRPGARRDHHLIGAELFAGLRAQQVAPICLDRPEPGVAPIDVDVGCRAPVVLATEPDRIDSPEDPRDDVAPAHLIDVRVDAVARGAADRLGDFGGVDEHLGRDTADVQAGAAEGALFADRHSLVRKAIVDNGVARTGSDDREVVGLHLLGPYPFPDDAEAPVLSLVSKRVLTYVSSHRPNSR